MEISTYRKIYWPILVSILPLTFGLHYVWQRLRKILNDDDLERKLKILKSYESDSDSECENVCDDITVQTNTSLHCVGVITTLENDYGLIDEKFYFNRDKYINLKQNDRVSFVVYKLNDDHTHIIKDIKKYDDDCWDEIPFNQTDINQKTIIKDQCQIIKRNIIGEIIDRDNRILHIKPLDIKINLNEIESNFIPYVGDWIVLETFTEVDESVSDLSGNVLSVKCIYPLRAKPIHGTVKTWNSSLQAGTINNNIYFCKENCEAGYAPAVGDKILSEIIESNQNSCSWRALTVSLNLTVQKSTENSKFTNDTNNELQELIKNKNGIIITDDLTFSSMNLNENRHLKVKIFNGSNIQHKILRCSFHIKKSLSQLRLLSHNINDEIILNPQETVFYEFECYGKFLGKSNELFVFTFKGFKIGRWFTIDVINNQLTYDNNRYVRKNYENLAQKFTDREKNDIFRGVRLIKPPAFVPIKLGMYNIPNKLYELILCNKSIDEIITDIENCLPCFKNDLNFNNYNDRFHNLLYFEEIQMSAHIQSYDMERVRFIINGEYLMLEILNLNERRPSLIIGDRVLAINPWNTNSPKYEGFIHKIQAQYIYLKFSSSFHASYQGQDYNIEFTFMRTSMRRCHQAIGLAVKNLGSDFLFPNGVKEKLSQINCDEIKWCNKNLNFHQKHAISNILKGVARPLPYIIFGPPGTGKTVTLVEAALQIIQLIPGSRLLIASPSNSSADLLATRLLESKILNPGDLVRLVAHRCVTEGLIPEHLLPYCATGDLAREGTASSKEGIVDGIRLGCSSTVLGRHRITVATCICLGQLYNMGFAKGHFTHVLVDEAGQATEPEILVPLSLLHIHTGQVILAGDPLQLGPVVLSKIACHFGMEESILVRLTRRFPYERDLHGFPETGGYDPRLVTRLVMNYRSVPEILNLPSNLFYDGELQPQISQISGEQADILKIFAKELPQRDNGGPPALVFHGVRGENYQQMDCPSWYNPHEALQVFYYLTRLYSVGIKVDDIGIITPYLKQVKEIRKLIIEKDLDVPKISSVEDFQGQERNVIILSTVRSTITLVSNDIKHFLGFITSPRRLNVALTRAQALLIIIGNPHVLALDPYWRSILQYAVENDAYVGCDLPLEYINVNNL